MTDDDGVAEVEEWLADVDAEVPFDVFETVAVLRELLDNLFVLEGVDAGTLGEAAEWVELGKSAGVLAVLAGLAERLAQP